MTTMKLYGFPPTRSIRVLWMLRELGVDFDFVNVSLMAGENRRPGFSRSTLLASSRYSSTATSY